MYDRSFGLEAVQAMQAETTLEDLYLLVDRSLIQELPGQQFEFLSLIQQCAQQQAETLTPAHQKATHYYQRRCLSLRPLLQQLTEQVDDTLLAVGSESMASSLLVYDYVKTAAKHAPGLKSVADQLGERFKLASNRRSKAAQVSTPVAS